MRQRFVPVLAVVAAAGCGRGEQASRVIRLQDLFDRALVEGSPAAGEALPRTEWRFDAPGGSDVKVILSVTPP